MKPLEEYLGQCEEVIAYEQQLKDVDCTKYNELAIEAERQEIQNLWTDWKESYKKCMTNPDCTKDEKITIKKKKIEVHDSYMRSVTIIGGWKDSLKTAVVPVQKSGTSVSVPPCDTQVFHGDYLSWPSFRDLFTAIYVNNKKLSPVEKLYHLFQKTSGEAREINKNIPLTAEGFEMAWGNLKTQYENERILVNNQLRTLFNLSQCSHETASGLKKLQREIQNAMSVLKVLKINIESWDPIFVYQCTSKLPKLTLSLWEQSIARSTELPKWETLDAFLTDRYHALESVSDILSSSTSVSRQKYNNFEKTNLFKVHHTKVNNQKCSLCKALHNIKSCPKFLNMDFKNRISVVRKFNYCLNCLFPGHMVVSCQSRNTCSKCNMKHHTLLHKKITLDQNGSGNKGLLHASEHSNSQISDSPTTSANAKAFHTSVSSKTMLATAWVKIVKGGESHRIRALIDPCSDDTFISSRIQRLLKLPTRPITADITGLGGEAIARCSEIAFFTLGSIELSNFSIDTDALVVTDVTGNVPTHSFDSVVASQLPRLNYADPEFYRSGPVDLLIGGNLYPLILLNGVEHNILGSLVAQETVFGWIVTGPTKNRISNRSIRVSHCTRVSINEQMAKFWEIEEMPKEKSLSNEDKQCEEIYKQTTVRRSDGRYVVDLPFKTVPPLNLAVPSNRYIALSQFLRNEKSLQRKSDLKSMYDEVIQEYLTLGHMEQVDSQKGDLEDYFYLPHHAVFKPESVTTKLRVVFNASCPSSQGKSLNDMLYIGPVLQKDIVSLILNWRLYKYVFNADISKMYRQIFVNPKHAPYQRILFRASPDEEIKDFQLLTVTFGVCCAPYLALRTLLQLADDEENRFPVGARILRENMYVDDALVGTHSVLEAIEARNQLTAILESGGFVLRKWTSNNRAIISDIPPEHLLNCEFLDFDDKSIAKTLGIRWNAVSDSFYFVTEKIQNKVSFTKREVLSVIARLFDPLGWLAPVVITAKVLMQQLWLDDIKWDDTLKPLTLVKWKSFVEKYTEIDKIHIPRWITYSPECKVEFHGFCDSSELAYAATLYARIEIGSSVVTNLLISKCKVAPIKKLSLPRLELCGALLLSEIIDTFLPQIRIDNRSLELWSDSTIVLAWLRKPSHSWTTFVANRVSKIHNRVGNCWRHVSTYDNPADLATRGLTPLELKDNQLWWHGPPWLKDERKCWPSNTHIPETSLESKSVKAHIARSSYVEDLLDQFSCLSRAIHVIAYIMRFFTMTHPSSKDKTKFITVRLSSLELTASRNRLMLLSQKYHFPKEYECLMKQKSIDSKSSLLTLTPFMDKNQLLRANGRLGSTRSLSYGERHPVILSNKGRFTKLYIEFIHKLTLHGGIRLMLATLRLECWIIRAKNLLRASIHNCKICVIARKKLQQQIMADLPPERTTLSRPFTNTGVDYAGPFEIKTIAGRGYRLTKGYICLFICFATKAIHLEAVSDLSTPAFLAALSRFISRRGCPNKIYSDNGRNFVGAAREIKSNFAKTLNELKDEAVHRYSFQKLEWHFIPASAPHMGGLWEAGVKSCKTHLKKIAGQVKYTFEEFSTILSSIESCLNSRPLTPFSEDVEDLGALTPGHFLSGSALMTPAEPETFPSPASLLNRWRRLKVTQYEFCRRWKSEYLRELQKRNKWKQSHADLQENDLVVLRNEAVGPNDWRLGRVIKLYHGHDGHVRVVDLKTQLGVITRPVHKLVLLPRSL